MARARAKNIHNGGEQLPLITPPSAWAAPAELPDLRGRGELIIAEDLETKDESLNAGRGSGWPYRAGHIAGVAWAWGEGQSIYAPVRHPDSENFDEDAVRRWMADHRAAPNIRWLYHSANYDLGWSLAQWGIEPPKQIEDSIAACVMVDENRLAYDLDSLCKWRGLPGKDESLLREAAAAWGFHGDAVKGNLWRLPARYVGYYAQLDASSTLSLFNDVVPTLEAEGTWDALRLEMDLVPMCLEMRRRGIRVDLEGVARSRAALLEKRDAVLRELAEQLGVTALGMEQVRSPRWLEKAHDSQRIGYPRTAKASQGSFTKDWMRGHAHWLPRLVSRADQLTEAADKFLKGFILDYAHRGRLHASVNQYRGESGDGTRSHRFSYSDPALQQAPSRDEEMAAVFRGAFLPEPGEVWGSLDYCYDDQTEILTEDGWKLFADLGDERVAQWDSGVVSFVKPMDKYVGAKRRRKMIHLRSPHQLDFCVTKDHRCLLTDYKDNNPMIVRASDLPSVFKFYKAPQAGVLDGNRKIPVALLRFIVALQADAADRRVYGGNTWVFYLGKARKIERLLSILKELGIPYRYKNNAKGNQAAMRINHDTRIDEFLGPNKTFKLPALLALTPELRDIFLDELGHWDGSIPNRKMKHTYHFGYGSTNLANLDVIQAVVACTNRRAAIRKWGRIKGKKPFASMTITTRNGTWGTRQTKIKEIDYHGQVYCVTVPSGFVITRRKGRVVVSGNSQQEYRLLVHWSAVMGLTGAEAAAQRYRDDPNTDFHLLVAEMTGLERKPAKDTNFSKIYGAGIPKFARMIGQSEEAARVIMEQYDRELPFPKEFARQCQQLAESRGWIKLLDGARSHFDMWEPIWRELGESYGYPRPLAVAREHWGPERRLRRAFGHKATNRKIQGDAARQIKMAMRECWRAGLVPLIQMHDELAFSFAEERQAILAAELMRDVAPLRVPMRVDAEFGLNWGSAKHTWAEAKRSVG